MTAFLTSTIGYYFFGRMLEHRRCGLFSRHRPPRSVFLSALLQRWHVGIVCIEYTICKNFRQQPFGTTSTKFVNGVNIDRFGRLSLVNGEYSYNETITPHYVAQEVFECKCYHKEHEENPQKTQRPRRALRPL